MKIFIVSVMILWLAACNTSTEEKRESQNSEEPQLVFPYTIDALAALRNHTEFKLSDFGDSIQYVPLQGLAEAPIAFLANVEVTPEFIFVKASHNTGILRYDRNGQLLNKIGKIGNGPGEVNVGSSFSLSVEEKLVYVQRRYTYNVLGFTYDGDFTKVLYTDTEKLGYCTFPLSANRILRLGGYKAPPEYIPPELYEMALYDGDYNLIFQIPSALENTTKWRSGQTAIYFHTTTSSSPTWFNNRLHHKAFSSDTIYEASLDSIYPKYILDKGKAGPPPEADKIIEKGPYGDPYDFLFTECLWETKYWLLCRASYHDNSYIIRVNKTTGALESMECVGCAYYNHYPQRGDQKNIVNDLDGGVSFYPHYGNRQGDVWIYSISALDYIEQMDQFAKKGKIDLNDQSSEPVRVYHSLTADSNPVLVFLHLKK